MRNLSLLSLLNISSWVKNISILKFKKIWWSICWPPSLLKFQTPKHEYFDKYYIPNWKLNIWFEFFAFALFFFFIYTAESSSVLSRLIRWRWWNGIQTDCTVLLKLFKQRFFKMIFSTGYILFVLAVTSNANWKVGKQRKYILTEI